MSLFNRNIVLGITGGIAAYKSAYLARLLIKAGAAVQVIMTEAGTKFVTPLTFEALTGKEVAVEMFPENRVVGTRHISLAEWPDLIVVAPATADFIGQIAYGLCPSLLSAVVCATRRPVLLAPAMNEGMYANPAVQQNIATLRQRGYHFAEVGVGEMACRSYGAGRMAEPEDILKSIVDLLSFKGPLSGKKILVTAGPCREPLDPVRFLSNRSSGKMGYAVTRQAFLLGGEVTLISGPVALADLPGVRTIKVETTAQMAEAVESEVDACDYLIMAAAPADFKPRTISPQKIKKDGGDRTIELTAAPDILKRISARRRPDQIIVGFALETENELENAARKLRDKKLDYIVVNNPFEEGAGFETETNCVIVLNNKGKSVTLELADKDIIARKLWEFVLGDAR